VNVRYATLAYGTNLDVHREATMLVVSLLAYAPPPYEIVIVTDRAERFSWLGALVRIRVLTPGELNGWRGTAPFSMRQKLEAARAAMPSEGALVFLDADTLAATDLSPLVQALADGALLMHKREFELGESRRRGNRQLWSELQGRIFGGWEFRAEDAMWNSGVLGLTAGDAGLLDAALSLYDAMANAGIRHFATEQLVAGLVLARTGRLRPAEQWFTHYWGNKDGYDREIAARLDGAHRTGMTATALADALKRDPITFPAEVRPTRLDKIRRWFSLR
jgi:hypothetical protein